MLQLPKILTLYLILNLLLKKPMRRWTSNLTLEQILIEMIHQHMTVKLTIK